MKRRDSHSAPLGGVQIRVPAGYELARLSDAEQREIVTRWITASPDACLYHAPSYLEFSRQQNGSADLLWLIRNGNPVLGVPVHAAGQRRYTTAYAGLLFPDSQAGGPLRRGVEALVALLRANRWLQLQILQSPGASAYNRPGRVAALGRVLDERRLTGPPLYSRILGLTPLDQAAPPLEPELLLSMGLEPYEAELRNQIRQAVRYGLIVQFSLPTEPEEIRAAYRDFVPLHRESWGRTGMEPHDQAYWEALSQAVTTAGGRDLIVWVHGASGELLAAVICHLRDDYALYWAGASNPEGLRARANPLCLHAAIQACRQLGVRRFELGRFHARESSDKERAVTRYKAQFGGGLVRIVGAEAGSRMGAAVLGRFSRLRLRAR